MRRTTDKYHLLRSFCCVVEEQSFAKAAIRLGIPTSSISKNIRQLENDIGQSLLIRTTRSMALTDAGSLYFSKGKQLLRNWQEMDDEINGLSETPSGLLRVTLPVAIGQLILSPVITKFMIAFPKIKIDLVFTHEKMELIEDDF